MLTIVFRGFFKEALLNKMQIVSFPLTFPSSSVPFAYICYSPEYSPCT